MNNLFYELIGPQSWRMSRNDRHRKSQILHFHLNLRHPQSFTLERRLRSIT